MSSLALIQVRVQANQAQAQIRQLQMRVAALEKQLARAGAASAGMATKGIPGLSRWGNQIQWAGRQLQYNFTLPIVLAGAAATKFALDNERAFVRIKKVYGDATHDAEFYKIEIVALEKAFDALSGKFGINKAEVMDIAAGWAAAGSSGLALAKATELTLQTMILGELEAVEATEALIAIQAQYGQTVKGLAKTIDTLNMIENQTGISMNGLILGFARSAGVARSAGIDVEHLGAMLAALVPASGTAANAGNALKTIISRLLSPTKEAAEVMGLMGINTAAVGWQSLNGAQRLELMAKSYKNVSGAQKIVVASTIASRWQVNRFDVLMRDIINTNGYYQKSLNSTKVPYDNFIQKQKELNAVLSSNPQRLKQIWAILQNAMANIIQPLIPVILMLTAAVARMAQGFQNLDPNIQKLIVGLVIFLAVIGPLARYLGSVASLLGLMKEAAKAASGYIILLAKGLWSILFFPFSLIGAGLGKIAGMFLWMGGIIKAVFVTMIIDSGLWAKFMRGLHLLIAPGIAAIGLMAKGLGIIWGVMEAALLKGSVLFLRGIGVIWGAMEASLIAISKAYKAAMIVLWGVMQGGLLGITKTFARTMGVLWGFMEAAILATVKVFSLTVGVVWGFMESSLLAISKGYKAAMVALWGFMQGGLLGITKIFALAVGFVWGVMEASLLAISKASKVAMVFLWRLTLGTILSGVKAFAFLIGTVWGLMEFALITSTKKLAVALPLLFLKVGTGIATGLWAGLKAIPGLLVKVKDLIVLGLRSGFFSAILKITGWWALALTAILGLVYTFRDQIAAAWRSVVTWFQNGNSGILAAFVPIVDFFNRIVDGIERAFWRLPVGIRDAFLTVVRIVKTAAMAVYELFSYFNPFAKHSPSLVDSVKKGMTVVGSEQGKVANVGGAMSKAATDVKSFNSATSSITPAPFANERADLQKALPSAMPQFNRLIADLKTLNSLLAAQQRLVDKQQATVDLWKRKLDAANVALDIQTAKLDKLQTNLDKLTAAYDAHNTAMQDFANAPLAGMGAVNDAIFENSMAQKKLQLEMLKMGDTASTGSIDNLRDKYALLQGEIEKLRGVQSDLRGAGAGSEILGTFDSQISGLQGQQVSVGVAVQESPVIKMQLALEALQRQAEIMDLEKALKFDPLLKQVSDLADMTKELTFEQIITGIKKEQLAMAALEPQIASATAAVDKQKLVVDSLTVARDAISATYDKETAKLDVLTAGYQKIEEAIKLVEDALNKVGAAAADANQKLEAKKAAKKAKAASDYMSPGAKNFLAGEGASFPEVGGINEKIGREGGIADQGKLIDEFTKSITDDVTKAFGEFDMFGPIKEWWNKAWKWIEENIGQPVGDVVNALKESFSKITNPFKDSTLGKNFQDIWTTIKDIAKSAWDGIKKIFELFAPDIKRIFDAIVIAGRKIWNEIGPELEKFKEPLSKLGEAFTNIWEILKPLVIVIGGVLLVAIKLIATVISTTLGPVLNLVITIITSVIKVIRGVLEFVVGVFAGDWAMAWQGVKDIFAGIWDTIYGIFRGVWDILWGILEGIVKGVIEAFQWLKDLLVGHSIIPDMINAIVKWFKDLGPWVVEHVVALVNAVIEWFKGLPQKVWDVLIFLKDKIGDVATKAWAWYTSVSVTAWATVIAWFKGLPQKAWDNFILLKDKIGDVASKAWAWFSSTSNTAWTTFIAWVVGLPQKAWNNLIAIKDKIGDVASKAWAWFSSTSSTAWDAFIVWIKGLPQKAWNGIIAIKDRLIDIARTAFQALRDKAEEMVDGKNGFMSWIKAIPGKVATAMAGIGSSVANAIKGAWNGAANWLNDHAIDNINKVTTKLGFTIGKLPTFEKGGVVPGGQSKKDNTIITARSGEGVVVPEAVRAIGGAAGINLLNRIAESGGTLTDFMSRSGMSGFAQGGVIGGTGDGIGDTIIGFIKSVIGNTLGALMDPLGGMLRRAIPGDLFVENLMASVLDGWAVTARAWGNAKDIEVDAAAQKASSSTSTAGLGSLSLAGGTGYLKQMEILRAQFPGMALLSGYRPGSITSSGNLSYHAQGRAVDIPPSMTYFDWIRAHYGSTSKELIHTPAGSRQIKDGSPFTYTGQVAMDHYDHVHWAYDKGGYLKPGTSQTTNRSRTPEPVFNAAQWSTLRGLVVASANVLKSSGIGAGGTVPGLRGGALMKAQARSRQAGVTQTTQPQTVNNNTEYHFHGDLSFPNIKSGDDADTFLKNLKSLAGGK